MTTSQQAADYRRDLDALLVVLLSALVGQWRDRAALPILLPGSARSQQRHLSPDEVNAATDVLMAGIPALIATYQASAAAIAADFYDEVRTSAEVRGGFSATPADVRDDARQEILVRWATEPLRRPLAPAARETVPTVSDLDRLGEGLQDPHGALLRLVGASERQVLSSARHTVADSVERDPADARWARQAKPGACAFCLVMAGRGPVYHSKLTAGGEDANRYHDDCSCLAVPSWSAAPYEPDQVAQDGEAAYVAARGQTGSGDLKTILAQMRQDTGAR